MALVLKDRVKETSTTTGTGAFTLAGAVTGYQSFSAVGDGNTTYYCIAGQTTNEWEVGVGTYTASGTSLSRDTILASSNSNSIVTFSAGTKDVFVVYPAGKSVNQDASGVTTIASLVATTADINGGTIDGTAIGSASRSTGAFTTVTVTDGTTFTGEIKGDGVNSVVFGGTPGTLNTKIQVSGSVVGTFSTTGLSVTGTLSATGKITGTSAGGDYAIRAVRSAGDTFAILPQAAGSGSTLLGLNAAESDYEPVALWSESFSVQARTGVATVSQVALFNSTGLAVTGALSTTDVATFPAGTAALPSITTTGDTNTGIYFPAADTIAFTEGGAEAMRIDSSGNVGIGTTTPSTKLDVTGTLSATGLSVVNSTAALLRATINASNVTAQQVDIAFTNSGGSTYIGQDAAGYSFIDARGALNAITLGYSGAVVTTIGSTGLTMASGMSVRGANNLTLNATTGNSVFSQVNNVTVTSVSSTGLSVTGTLSATSTASVGPSEVGVITPNLGVYNTGNTWIVARDTTNDQEVFFGATSSLGVFGSATNIPLEFRVNNSGIATLSSTGLSVTGTLSSTGNFTVNTDRVVLTAAAPANSLYLAASGNLGLGVSTPSTKLHLLDTGPVYIQMTDSGDGASRVGQNGTALTFGVDGADGSTERMRIDSSGNVGIGTASPSYRLDISGSAATIRAVGTSASNPSLILSSAGITAWSQTVSGSDSSLSWSRDSTERMRIDSSGNVGIGTASPSVYGKLGVSGNIAAFSGSGVTTITSGSGAGGVSAYDLAGAYYTIATSRSSDGAVIERLRIDASGNVGIGTASPGTRLDVSDTTAVFRLTSSTGTNYVLAALQNTGGALRVGAEGSSGGSLLTGSSAYSGIVGTTGAYPLAFGTNAAERMRIDSSGNVGIGTASPGNKLVVEGAADTSVTQIVAASGGDVLQLQPSTSGNGARLRAVNNAQSDFEPLSFVGEFVAVSTRTGVGTSTERMRIDASGNVGINTTSPGSTLDVKGTLRLSGSTSGYVGLAPAAAAGSTTYTLPSADGTSGQVLSTNGSGTLSWATGITLTSGSAPYYGVRAWVSFNGTGTVAINASGNVTSITDNGTGDYTVNITTALPNANYPVVATGQYAYNITVDGNPAGSAPTSKTTTACRLYAGDGYTGSRVDVYTASVVFVN